MDNPTPQDFTHYIQALKQLKELTTVSNPWIPVWSAVIGGLIASIPTGIGALYRARSTRKSVETAISAEIANIASMIRKRNYLNLLKEIRSELIEINNQIASVHDDDETSPNFCSRAITVTISADYYKIYKANLDKLGIINNKKLLKIVNFYSHLESIMLDVKPEGNLGKGGSVEDYTEVIIFLEDALKLADELSTQTT
ncbi:hypothetical protein FQ186_18335 [Pseudomonas sp. ANT_H14]|uniref:hypothetical protein n=1 Tax=unclassified Pseudomonas TaxID=196821 RepID=UPI0011EC3A89|nr:MULTISPECIES: hypothetical protein [unclassified Pseudomonas]KAA0943926.1 hypothetical protein FQ182_22210 [Pseudomonas sp. ANT_H4]KAA0951010.1 hypothetical protein FQ186_18335 [Pseudomonas sp. ANT_H14]